MGSSGSVQKTNVEGTAQATVNRPEQFAVTCQLCNVDPTIKWRCFTCNKLFCDLCMDRRHARINNSESHFMINIKDVGKDVTLRLNKQYTTNLLDIEYLCSSSDGSIWVNCNNDLIARVVPNGDNLTLLSMFKPAAAIGSSPFGVEYLTMAVLTSNEVLLNTRLQYNIKSPHVVLKIDAQTGRLSGSVYRADPSFPNYMHVTREGKVMLYGYRWISRWCKVTILDGRGKTESEFKLYKRDKRIFPRDITSTLNGFIHVLDEYQYADGFSKVKVVVLSKKGESVNTYEHAYFVSGGIVATPQDNVVVLDRNSGKLHITNSVGYPVAVCDTKDIGITMPYTFNVSPNGSLWISCSMNRDINQEMDNPYSMLYLVTLDGC